MIMNRLPPFFSAYRTIRWVWIGYWLAAFTVTHIPKPGDLNLPIQGGDKVLHAMIYFILTLMGGRVLMLRAKPIHPGTYAIWAVIYTIYGALDEYLQGFVHRTPSIYDWLADVLGILLATSLLVVYGAPADTPDGEHET